MAPNNWEYGLFCCFADCKTCCVSTCCPCVQHGLNQQKFNNKSGCCVDCCMACCAMTWFFPIYLCFERQLRTDIRKRYGINGSCLGDCCVVCCCGVCSQTQCHREMMHQEDQKHFRQQSQATIVQQPQMQAHQPFYHQGYQSVPMNSSPAHQNYQPAMQPIPPKN